MAVNQKKLISVLLAQVESTEERCKGYNKALLDTLGDILSLEKQNRIHGSNIRQKVSDKCSALGEYLNSNQNSN